MRGRSRGVIPEIERCFFNGVNLLRTPTTAPRTALNFNDHPPSGCSKLLTNQMEMEQNASISWASCFCSAPGTSNPVPNIPRSIAAVYRLEPNNLVDKASLVAVREKWEPPRAAVALDDPAEAAGVFGRSV